MTVGYELTESVNSIEIVFSSDLNLVSRVVEDALEFVGRKNCGVEEFPFKIALFESLVNAVKHGSNSDPTRNVKMSLDVKPSSLAITVEDEGDGFDWRSQMRIEEVPADVSKPSGRGIFLLRNYKCNPAYNEKGNVLSLRIDLA